MALSKKTKRRVMRAYVETLDREPADSNPIGSTALVMFAIAAVGVVVSLLTL